MTTQIDTEEREILMVEDARIRPMMGIDVLESLPSPGISYSLVDPFILVHEGVVPITPEMAGLDTKHPHRGFDNLWYLVSGSASTGHSTGPDGAMERARLQTGSLLKLRTGSGVWHAEGIGEDELREGKAGEMRGVLFWVNLARKDKQVAPSAQLLESPGRARPSGRRRHRPGAGRGKLSGRARDSRAHPGRRVAKGRSLHHPSPVRFQRLRLHAGRRSQSRRQPTPGEPCADCRTRTGSLDHRGRCAARNTFHAHGRKAIRRDADLQRTVCRLMALHGRHGGAGVIAGRGHRKFRANVPRKPGRRRIDGSGASDRYSRFAERLWMRRVSRIRWLVVPPSSLRRLWPHRLLRLVAIPARQPARGHRRSPGGPELRARRGLVLGLRERALHRWPGAGSAPPSPARPARAGTYGSGAPRLGATVALTRWSVCKKESTSQ